MRTTTKGAQLARKVKAESRTLATNLTYADACEYLSGLHDKLMARKGLQTTWGVPWVLAWWESDPLGFVVEVWMTQQDNGRWGIIDRSPPLYTIPTELDKLLPKLRR